MTSITVDDFQFALPGGWSALDYDKCTFYREHFNNVAASKATDLLALSPTVDELWLVEIKDYRRHRRTKSIDLFAEVATKARDTLAGLAAARIRAYDAQTRDFAQSAAGVGLIRVVLLLEQPSRPSKLFPQVLDPANGRVALRKAVRAIDPHPVLGNSSELSAKTAWTITPP
jgi:hypothetical protein